MRHEARTDRTNDEIRDDLRRSRASGSIVTRLSSRREEGVTRHAIVLSEGDVEQRIEVDVPAIDAPFVLARHAREGFHPALVGMVGPADEPDLTILLARVAPGEEAPRLLPPVPFRDAQGTFFAARAAPLRGLCVSIAAAGAPSGPRGEGLVIAGVLAPQPRVKVTWAVHLDALGDEPWRERWETRALERVADAVVALPITSADGAEWALSLWHDRPRSPWPRPDPFAQRPRLDISEAAGEARRDRISAFFIHGSSTIHAPLTRHFVAISPGDAPPEAIAAGLAGDALPEHPIDRFALDHMRETGARQGQIVVVRGRRLAFAKAYTLAEEGYPITRLDDAFRLGSVSKALTTAALLRLLTARGLDTSARVVDLLELGPDEGPKLLHTLTLGHLLTHTAGFPTFPDVRPDEPKNPLSEARITRALAPTSPLRAARPGDLSRMLRRTRDDGVFLRAPGSMPDPDYSNEGFILLGEVLSAIALGRPDGYEEAMSALLFEPAGVHVGERGALFGAGRKQARIRRESPAHPSSPTWAEKRFEDDLDLSPLTPSPYADNGPFLGGAAGLAIPLVWVARALAALGPRGDGTGLWSAKEAAIAATPATPQSRFGHGFHLGEPGFWTFRPSGGGAPRTVRMQKLHHNGRLDGGAALLVHLVPHDPKESGDATLSIVAAFNQLGPLYDEPHGKALLALARKLEGTPGWDSDLFERVP